MGSRTPPADPCIRNTPTPSEVESEAVFEFVFVSVSVVSVVVSGSLIVLFLLKQASLIHTSPALQAVAGTTVVSLTPVPLVLADPPPPLASHTPRRLLVGRF